MNNLRDLFLKFCAAVIAAAAIVGGAAKERESLPVFKKTNTAVAVCTEQK